jgi:dolichyl-diphosphooligosaccharide--protein glycosyltransferase
LQQSLIKTGNFEFKIKYLLIIGVLILAFTTSFLIRSQSVDYGFELNEFDPFFNFRATEFIVENGISEYFEWHDDLSWYPEGRNISATSQVMLHITAAGTYQLFGGNSDLYDFTILFPVIFSSLTSIVIFGLVRVIGGTTAGLFASL